MRTWIAKRVGKSVFILDGEGNVLAKMRSLANARRAAACVNACWLMQKPLDGINALHARIDLERDEIRQLKISLEFVRRALSLMRMKPLKRRKKGQKPRIQNRYLWLEAMNEIDLILSPLRARGESP